MKLTRFLLITELLNQRIAQALSSGLKNLGSAVLFAREEMKDAMSH